MTYRTLLRVALLSLLALVLVACSTASRQAARPVVRTIAVIPAADPDWYSLRNRNALALLSGIAMVATLQDSRVKAQAFTDKVIQLTPPLGQELTRATVDALNRQGFEARVLTPEELGGQDPRDLDYERIKPGTDAVLHVSFTDVGVYSGYTSADYLPKTNIYGYLFNPRDAAYIHEESVFYGADAREGKTWGVPADPRYAYRSFDELQQKVTEVADGFSVGTRAAAQRMAENMRKALR